LADDVAESSWARSQKPRINGSRSSELSEQRFRALNQSAEVGEETERPHLAALAGAQRPFGGGKSTAVCRSDQARRLKELVQENSKLKRLVSEPSLDKPVLNNIASGTSKPDGGGDGVPIQAAALH
jgi:hypothetical protein